MTYRAQGAAQEMVVKGLKLHKRGELSKGLQIQGENTDSQERVFIRLAQLIDLKRDIGNDLFSRDRFLNYYADYQGSR